MTPLGMGSTHVHPIQTRGSSGLQEVRLRHPGYAPCPHRPRHMWWQRGMRKAPDESAAKGGKCSELSDAKGSEPSEPAEGGTLARQESGIENAARQHPRQLCSACYAKGVGWRARIRLPPHTPER